METGHYAKKWKHSRKAAKWKHAEIETLIENS